MIHIVTLNPALDLSFQLQEPSSGKIGKVRTACVEAGGKALNVARFLRQLKVRHRTWIGTGGGDDPTHILYRALLTKERLAVSFLSNDAPIRLNLVVDNGKNARKYNHPGFEEDLTAFPRLLKAVKKNDLLVMTGRLPDGMNESLYASWVKAFGRRGVRTVVDASGKALVFALKAKPWFFKVNLYEFSEAMSKNFKNLDNVGRSLEKVCLSRGLVHGAITDGSHGAIVWKGREAFRVHGRSIRSKLIVGAGDGFLAGYLKCVSAGKSLKESAVFACASGAAVATQNIRGFDKKSVEKHLKSVKVKKIL